MKDNKGQALIEFVLILPVLIVILLSIVDIGNIIMHKYQLENDLDLIVNMYQKSDRDGINAYLNEHSEAIEYESDNQYTTIKLSQKVSLMNPVLNAALDNGNCVVKRTILKEVKDET